MEFNIKTGNTAKKIAFFEGLSRKSKAPEIRGRQQKPLVGQSENNQFNQQFLIGMGVAVGTSILTKIMYNLCA